MKQFWQRLSRRERGLVALTVVILSVALGRYLLIGPFLDRWDSVRARLEIEPQLLEKNLRFLAQREELATALEVARSEIKAK